MSFGLLRSIAHCAWGLVLTLAIGGCRGEEDASLAAVLTPRPGSSVIVVSFDALRPDALGAYGYALPTSPALDAFSRQAVLFENAYATAPKTPTAFAGAFTGRYPNRVFRDWRLRAETTIASMFRAAGYRTAAFANNPQLVSKRGFGAGFETYAVFGGVADEGVATRAASWLAGHAGEPVFLWLHLIDPHAPWLRRSEAAQLYDADYSGRFRDRAARLIALEDPAELARVRSLYDGEVAAVDRIFADFVAALRRDALLDDAIVVVTSDHGEEFMEHGHLQHGWLTEENIRVPLIVHHPDTPGGVRVPQRVSHLDLLPTLLALAGIPAPADLDGRSWLDPIDPHRPIIAVANTERHLLGASIRVGDRKLIVRCGRISDRRLFDLVADPGERQDLLPGAVAEADALEARLWQSLAVPGCEALAMDSPAEGSPSAEGSLPAEGSDSRPDAETRGLDAATIEALESLGYLEGEGADQAGFEQIEER